MFSDGSRSNSLPFYQVPPGATTMEVQFWRSDRSDAPYAYEPIQVVIRSLCEVERGLPLLDGVTTDTLLWESLLLDVEFAGVIQVHVEE